MSARPTGRILRAITPLLLSLLPTRDLIVVHGWRDSEENALRVAGGLTRRAADDMRIVLLCEDPDDSRRHLTIALRHETWNPAHVTHVRKNSLRGYFSFLQARLVLMTHGLFGNPSPGRRRVHVLLGHGHGPKSGQDPTAALHYRTQVATTNNAVWGTAVIETQFTEAPGADSLPRIAITGNPRDDAFDEPIERDRLASIGLDPARRFILWLPTYRPGRASAAAALDDRTAECLDALRRSCAARGVDLVTKTHQLDDENNASTWGMNVITTTAMRDAGLTFMQLLSLSSGLISDYSSVWVDYLRTGHPVALLFPDYERFDEKRGFNTPLISEVAPELVLSEPEKTERFVEIVAAHNPAASWRTAVDVAARLALVTEPGATERVLDVAAKHLDAHGLDGVLTPAVRSQP